MPDSLKTYHKSKKLYDVVKDSVEHSLRINAEKLASMQVPEQIVSDSTNHKNRKLQILKAQIQDVEDALYSAQTDGNTKDANVLLRRLHKLEDDAKKLKDIEKREEEELKETEEEKKKRLEEEAKKKAEEEAKKKDADEPPPKEETPEEKKKRLEEEAKKKAEEEAKKK